MQSPADPQTLNRYSYVRNNPVKYTDPSGHFFGFIASIIGVALGIAGAAGFVASQQPSLGKFLLGIFTGRWNSTIQSGGVLSAASGASASQEAKTLSDGSVHLGRIEVFPVASRSGHLFGASVRNAARGVGKLILESLKLTADVGASGGVHLATVLTATARAGGVAAQRQAVGAAGAFSSAGSIAARSLIGQQVPFNVGDTLAREFPRAFPQIGRLNSLRGFRFGGVFSASSAGLDAGSHFAILAHAPLTMSQQAQVTATILGGATLTYGGGVVGGALGAFFGFATGNLVAGGVVCVTAASILGGIAASQAEQAVQQQIEAFILENQRREQF